MTRDELIEQQREEIKGLVGKIAELERLAVAISADCNDMANERNQLRAELAAIKSQEPVAFAGPKVLKALKDDDTFDKCSCVLAKSAGQFQSVALYAAPVAKQVVMPEREWLQSDGLIYSLENDVNYYEINVTQVEGNRHDGKRAEFASKLIELLNADNQGGKDE